MILKTKNSFLFLSILPLLFLFSCSRETQSRRIPAENQPVLRVAVDPDMPGYFRFNDQTLGYTYDLLDAYAQSFGRKLEMIPVNSPGAFEEARQAGRIDMKATLRPYSVSDHTAIAVYETSYVILASSRKAANLDRNADLYSMLAGRDILFTRGFSSTRCHDEMVGRLAGAHLNSSDQNTFELLEGLINGRFDFLICERSEAQLGCSLIRNIEQVYEFQESVSVCVLFDREQPEEGRRFTNWLYSFRQSGSSEELHALYFEKGITQRIISGGIKNRPAGAISVYDELFKQVTEEEDLDWRLVSAIAYSESKYNAYLVSPRGARGLMQVMPATARAFEVPVDDLMDPEANVRVAVRLIRNIEKSLKFSAGASREDRTNIMLACYNAGIGHVTDARRLASKYGANPDSWSDVLHYLQLKSQPEYAEDEAVRCGVFNGAGETRKFVNHVIGKYYAYCGKNR